MAENGAGNAAVSGAATPAGNEGDWGAGFDEDTRGWLGGMGIDKLPANEALAKVIPMYRGAEQKLGIPPDQLLRMPKDDNDADGFRGVMSKLGLPETPDGYELKVPEGKPDEFLKTATGWFHELGIPKRQAAGLAGKWNEYVSAQEQLAEDRFATQADSDILALKNEMGESYDKNVELARRVRRAAGISDEEAISIERTIGVARAMKVFAELGKSMGEHKFVGGDDGGTFGMSIEGARARITALKSDKEWQSKYLAGDADKVAEWTRLHMTAYPEG